MSLRNPAPILRAAQRSLFRQPVSFRSITAIKPVSRTACPISQRSHLHVSTIKRGIMPENSDPPPREAEAHDEPEGKFEITADEYHMHADTYLEVLLTRLEQKAEKDNDLDADYSAGVLSIEVPKLSGTYILNKQPANRQIWLSSPVSGPKRYDWVVSGEGMNDKEGSGVGDWIYLRDGSSLGELLRKEIGVDVREVQMATDDNDIAIKATNVETTKNTI